MPVKANIPINNFNSGELGPLLEARFDLTKYAAGCKTLENAFPLIEGGIKKMPGTVFVGRTKDDAKARLVPFQFSTTQGAMLEFTEELVRVWTEDGLLLGSSSVITQYDNAHAYALGEQITIGNYAKVLINWADELEPDDPDNKYVYVASEYGQADVTTTYVHISRHNHADVLDIFKGGVPPHQYIGMRLANATKANNTTALIQAGIRALVFLNIENNNYIDLTNFVVSASAAYVADASSPDSIATDYMNHTGGIYEDIKTPGTTTGDFPPENAAVWELLLEQGILELPTPYAAEDLFDLDVSTQSADVLFIFHPDYPPASISRRSATYWTYELLTPYGTTNIISTGYSALGQAIQHIDRENPCKISLTTTQQVYEVGDLVYINLCLGTVEVNKGRFLIGSINDTGISHFWFTLQDPITGLDVDASGYTAYTGGGFAVLVQDLFTAVGDYPSCATIYEQRMIVAGTNNNPTRMKGSTQGDYPNFICDPNQEDYAIQFDLVMQKVDQIQWAIGGPNALIFGTAGGVWAMQGSSDQSLSQVSVNASLQIAIGTGRLAPQRASDCIIWATRSRETVRLLQYSFVADQWESSDVTRLNRSITKGPTKATSGLVQTAYQSDPYPIFFAVRADGQLLGMTFERQEQVYAWFRLKLGGTVESVAVLTQENEEDQLWVVVNREISGSVQRQVEYFSKQEIYSDLANAWFVHAGLQWSGGDAIDITAVTKASPCKVTSVDHGLTTGQHIQITGVLGMTQINQDATQAYVITTDGDDAFTLDDIDSSDWDAYTDEGTAKAVTDHLHGLTHLAEQTVVVIGDGAIVYQGLVAANGDVPSFSFYVNIVTIGLPFVSTIEPMNPILNSQQNTSRGAKQKIRRATFCFYETTECKFGLKSTKLYEIPEFDTGGAPALFTGDITKDLPGEWADEATICIVHDTPFPFTLKAIIPRLDAHEA